MWSGQVPSSRPLHKTSSPRDTGLCRRAAFDHGACLPGATRGCKYLPQRHLMKPIAATLMSNHQLTARWPASLAAWAALRRITGDMRPPPAADLPRPTARAVLMSVSQVTPTGRGRRPDDPAHDSNPLSHYRSAVSYPGSPPHPQLSRSARVSLLL